MNPNEFNRLQQQYAQGMQTATLLAASVFRYESEQKRLAQKEEAKAERRRKNAEAQRRRRERLRIQAVQSGDQSPSESDGSKNANSGKTSTRYACSSSSDSTCSPQAEKVDDAPATSSKKRKSSADNSTAALITPHKPQEDVLNTEQAESNVNNFDDDRDDEDNDMHCFDDDQIIFEEEDTNPKSATSTFPDQRNEGKVVEEEDMTSKPAEPSPPAARTSDDRCDEGKVGFVLIPLKDTADIPLIAKTTKYVYWPALIYSSFEAFESAFPLDKETRQLFATINREWPRHEAVDISLWSQQGIIPPIDNDNSSRTHSVKVAMLFGSEVPPSGTRSYPIYPRDITIVRGGQPHKSHIKFTAAKVNRLSESPGYANNSKFLEAVDMAKRYKFSKDTKYLSR